MKKIVLIITSVVLIALPAKASFGTLEQPHAEFHSTSSLSLSGSAYCSNPTLDDNGNAAYNAPSHAPSVPRKSGGLPVTPDPKEGDDGNTPIGDAALPMLLLAMAYTACAVVRRRRKQIA